MCLRRKLTFQNIVEFVVVVVEKAVVDLVKEVE
jgi:hypothetical protein